MNFTWESFVHTLIVYANEEPHSFNAAMKNLAVHNLEAQGHSVVVSDLYWMKFKAVADGEDFLERRDRSYLKRQLEEKAAAELGLTVARVPDYSPYAVAEHAVVRARFCVLSARETPALWNGRIAPLGGSPAERLGKLGVTWVDAATLVENLPRSSVDVEEFVSYMKQRYGPIFETA